MALILEALAGVLKKPTVVGAMWELLLFCAPLWVAVVLGLLLGWAWKPKWAGGLVCEAKERMDGGRLLSSPSMPDTQLRSGSSSALDADVSSSVEGERESRAETAELVVTTDDLEHLRRLVEVTDGGPSWKQVMDHSLPTMNYRAWRREPKTGPPQYHSRTIFEDATPEIVRDFFWDDEFRSTSKWDDMLIYHEILEECPATGTMVVHWVRKFPFFCSDREYIIGRRIWESGRTYYCVMKGVPCVSVPRRDKPIRVDLFYSSWCIRPVESRSGDGRLTACEVLLFHHEDVGIPRELVKLGVRQGMWAAVQKIEPGLRAYQTARKKGDKLSRCAFLAQINTKISADHLLQIENSNSPSEVEDVEMDEDVKMDKTVQWNLSKFLIIGGALLLTCTLDRGLLTRAVTVGVARRFARRGR